MQNIDLQKVVSTGTLTALYSPTTLQGYLDLDDLARVARLAILDPEAHGRARYELVGENCTYEDVAKEIEKQTGRAVRIEGVPREEVARLGGTHISASLATTYAVEGLGRMLYYYDKR